MTRGLYYMIGCESQLPPHEVKDCYSSTQHEEHDTTTPPLTLDNLESVIALGSDAEFEAILIPLSTVITLHVDHKLFTNKTLHYRLMKSFHRHFKGLGEGEQDQSSLLFLMSLMAELARKSQKIRLPFTRKIVLALLSFDCSTLKQQNHGCQVIKILAVLFENLSRQGKTTVKLGVQGQMMNGLLLLTSRVDELFTLRILFKAIRQLTLSAGLPVTKHQLEEYGVISGLADNFGEEVAVRVRVMLCHASISKEQTLKDLICKS